MNFGRKYNPYLTFHHENYLKCYLLIQNTSSGFYSAFFCHGFHFIYFLNKTRVFPVAIVVGWLAILQLKEKCCWLAGYITVKGKTHFCFRNDFQKSYLEDHSSDIEMTIAETNADVNWKLVLYQFSQSLFR